jgi:hypothetical protein
MCNAENEPEEEQPAHDVQPELRAVRDKGASETPQQDFSLISTLWREVVKGEGDTCPEPPYLIPPNIAVIEALKLSLR